MIDLANRIYRYVFLLIVERTEAYFLLEKVQAFHLRTVHFPVGMIEALLKDLNVYVDTQIFLNTQREIVQELTSSSEIYPSKLSYYKIDESTILKLLNKLITKLPPQHRTVRRIKELRYLFTHLESNEKRRYK